MEDENFLKVGLKLFTAIQTNDLKELASLLTLDLQQYDLCDLRDA